MNKKYLVTIIISAIALIWVNPTAAECVREDDEEINPECERLKEANEAELNNADEESQERRRSRNQTEKQESIDYVGTEVGVNFGF